jgi:hypothetical protein
MEKADMWQEELRLIERGAEEDAQFLWIFNNNVLRWIRGENLQEGDSRHNEQTIQEYKRVIFNYSKGKGLEYDSENKEFVWPMLPTRGEGLIGVSWHSGTLRVAWENKDGMTYYHSTEPVPETIADKLRRSLYPRNTYHQIVKGKYEMERE